MGREIIIDPVTRIEGHAKITIHLDDAGNVSDAEFHVTEFRGFEKFCEGRPMTEMPSLTGRICGICPVSHLLASAKATDALLAVQIPATAEKLRRLMNLGQFVQSHALSFFYLSAPDMLLGFDSDPALRNVVGLAAADPDLARAGIRLRQFGQTVIEVLGGKRIHPAWAVPGGVRAGLSAQDRVKLLDWIPECTKTAEIAIERFKRFLADFHPHIASFGDFPSLFLSLVAPDGAWEHYGGHIRVVDSNGAIVANGLTADKYQDYIAEATVSHSYLKAPYYRELGYPAGIYRVGPLARLNTCDRMGTPRADAELQEYRAKFGKAPSSSFLFHYARLIETIAAIENVELLLTDPDITGDNLRAQAGINALHGVGVSEAPRGTLFHDYTVDKNGSLVKVNLVIATGQNNLAMNKTVAQIAKTYIKGPDVPEGVLNRIEAGVRSFDPCLSCSTHAVGEMPIKLEILAADGSLVREVTRS
jgi:NAD-reducing hydrogenase large subunit